MARATRSSATQVQDNPPRTKSASKKRKRSDNDGHRIKDEHDDDNVTKLQNLQLAADVPIDPSDAQRILDILDM